MTLSTYSGLKTAIADHLDRDDLTSQIDDFIDLAEARHQDDVRLRSMLTRASLTVASRYVSLPSGYLEGMTLRLLTSPVTVLEHVSLDEMNRIRQETNDTPSFYTIHEQIEFDVAPDTSYSGEIIYYGAVTALSDGNTSNAILARSPGLYLYGALTAAAPFLLNDERIQVWAGFYASLLESLDRAEKRARHVGALHSRVIGATP